MDDEFRALENQGTWRLVPPTENQRMIGCNWVFKLKRDSNGNIARYKAKLVAKGLNQEPRLCFSETFSAVIKMTTIQLVLSLVLHFNWRVQQLNVKNAFLSSILMSRSLCNNLLVLRIPQVQIMFLIYRKHSMAYDRRPVLGILNFQSS